MKKILLIIICVLSVSIPSVIAVSNAIQAYLVDYKISYFGTLNNKLSYPLISYNDNTYMAVRDVAEILNKDISWIEEDQTIRMSSKSHGNGKEKNVIKEEKTALAIGKAIIEEYYKDEVNENSSYYVSYVDVTGLEFDDRWSVFVKFNPSETDDETNIFYNYDVCVEISVISGNFSIYDNNTKETIVDFIMY